MKIAEQVSVTITDGPHKGKTLLLDVEEFVPYEPSNYVWTPGWNCAVEIRGEVVWFFVDECGVVYDEGESVGICPAQEAEYERVYATRCEECEYEAAKMAYAADLGASEWEAFIDRVPPCDECMGGRITKNET